MAEESNKNMAKGGSDRKQNKRKQKATREGIEVGSLATLFSDRQIYTKPTNFDSA